MSDAFGQVAKVLCQFDRKLLRNSLHLLANDLSGNMILDEFSKPGIMHRRAGSVVHVLHCAAVNVTIRDMPICTQVCVRGASNQKTYYFDG